MSDFPPCEANGSINLDTSFVELILDLLANNERMIQQLEATFNQLNTKVDPLIEQMAEMRTFMKTGTKPATNAGKSFASVASAALSDSIHAPTTRPSPKQVMASLKPKRVIIHSNPANTTLKDVPSGALVQKANEALLGLDARVEGEVLAISFYTKNRAHQKWLMENKHVWSKAVHPDLEATPSTWSVMAHGIPKSFDISKPANPALLASKNNFQSADLARVRANRQQRRPAPWSWRSPTKILPSELRSPASS
ncbi:hypothetical protein PGT21_008088 [Puccinia graminis f. sp. tritici]|uniref:Uncharacterized protein n=1 Tax=Puccinia graminis f. sp. tritici TaxID=56615 RepID=A0A5B0NFE7_PUCGR|nr:hypothetical protein PGT21_008088 [Puccinia graminis f. sp. tritici]